MIARRIAYAVIGVVIVASGAYLFVYLYRWEWNRALIAGVIFVAAEIALVAGLILDKLKALETRISAPPEAVEATLQTLKETAPAPRARFKWLGGDELSVFVPVLMGAGIVFSGIAWLVERFARMTARPVLEQNLAVKLAPLALPEGGFLATVAPAPALRRRIYLRQYRGAFLALVLAATMLLSIDRLGDLTQNRPHLDVEGAIGSVTLDVSKRGWSRTDVEAVQSLWGACAGTVGRHMQAESFEALANGTIRMSLRPAPGISAQKRLTGCLEDATIDNMQARIVATDF